MQERWRMILEFPNYSISDHGRVRNEDTGRILTRLSNQRGIAHVGLTRSRVLYKRSITVLVAEAFLAPAGDIMDPEGVFDTPIHLDGDRLNSHVKNLMWRPRWFAVKYHLQFQQDGAGLNRPVEIIETGETFKSSWDAATTLGVLDREIVFSVMSKNYVWPLYQAFRLVR